MLAYHFGWDEEGETFQGKQLRPILSLLVHNACGGNWNHVIPAAAAIELIHNFSLIHDDIEDNSPIRRSRETLWRKWGIAQTINTGDALYTIALLELQQLNPDILSPSSILKANHEILSACLALTGGQHLDIAFEGKLTPHVQAYLEMIQGKTGALISTASGVGAILADSPDEIVLAYQEYGRNLGLAFQIQDDYLGIWGDPQKTGKSASSDLLSRKKTIPILHALETNNLFRDRWIGEFQESQISELVKIIENSGSKEYTLKLAEEYTQKALDFLETAKPAGASGEILIQLSEKLLGRRF